MVFVLTKWFFVYRQRFRKRMEMERERVYWVR